MLTVLQSIAALEIKILHLIATISPDPLVCLIALVHP